MQERATDFKYIHIKKHEPKQTSKGDRNDIKHINSTVSSVNYKTGSSAIQCKQKAA